MEELYNAYRSGGSFSQPENRPWIEASLPSDSQKSVWTFVHLIVGLSFDSYNKDSVKKKWHVY